MTLAIMQPYFFPYIGYWQLINAVDKFVIYDDVNFIKKGYINRNSVINRDKPQRITLELIGASQNKKINEIEIGNNRVKLLKTIEQIYKKAPFFDSGFQIIKRSLENPEKNLSRFLGDSIQIISDYLGIRTEILYSSDLEKNNQLKGQDKILDICRILDADRYINAIGGRELYDRERFLREEIRLDFLQTEPLSYRQFGSEFVPHLSIIDIMMFNTGEEIRNMLGRYRLV